MSELPTQDECAHHPESGTYETETVLRFEPTYEQGTAYEIWKTDACDDCHSSLNFKEKITEGEI